jgi:hypothetical protein
VVRDRFEGHLVAAADRDVVPAAARADGQHVGGLGAQPAVAAVDGGRHRDQLNYGAGRLGTRGHETERLRQGFLDHRMPDPEPYSDPCYLATAGALAYCLKHALAQAVLVHSAPDD